jgi:hypothetical protein
VIGRAGTGGRHFSLAIEAAVLRQPKGAHMRLVSFGPRGSEIPGVLVGDSVLPLPRVFADLGLPRTTTLRGALPFLGLLQEAVTTAVNRGDELLLLSSTRLGPPLLDPPNLFVCGANYFEHLAEADPSLTAFPSLPVVFLKPRSALSGPSDPIVRPVECWQFDYEAELAVVIGKAGRRIPAERAAEHMPCRSRGSMLPRWRSGSCRLRMLEGRAQG